MLEGHAQVVRMLVGNLSKLSTEVCLKDAASNNKKKEITDRRRSEIGAGTGRDSFCRGHPVHDLQSAQRFSCGRVGSHQTLVKMLLA